MKKIYGFLIFLLILLGVGCNNTETAQNTSDPEKSKDNYNTCARLGGRIYSDGKTSLSYCEFEGKIYQYDG